MALTKRRRRQSPGEEKVKKIGIRFHPKKTVFVVHYSDGRNVETPFVDIQGGATLYIDSHTKEPTIRTEANVSLGHNGTCAVCGGDSDDQHAHA